MDSSRIMDLLIQASDPRTQQYDQEAILELLMIPVNNVPNKSDGDKQTHVDVLATFIPQFYRGILDDNPEELIPLTLPLFTFLHKKKCMKA